MVKIEFNNKCHKFSYPTLKDARTVLNRLRVTRGKNVVKRIYKCESCDGYHFTKCDLEDVGPPMDFDFKQTDKWKKLLED